MNDIWAAIYDVWFRVRANLRWRFAPFANRECGQSVMTLMSRMKNEARTSVANMSHYFRGIFL